MRRGGLFPKTGEAKSMTDYIEAHRFSIHNRQELQQDKRCGCFYCLRIFDPKEITDWIEDAPDTAICPYCGVDSVIGAYTGYPISLTFLEKMHAYWF